MVEQFKEVVMVKGGRGGGGGKGTPAVGAPPAVTPPLTTKAAMVGRIKQLKQRFVTMASL